MRVLGKLVPLAPGEGTLPTLRRALYVVVFVFCLFVFVLVAVRGGRGCGVMLVHLDSFPEAAYARVRSLSVRRKKINKIKCRVTGPWTREVASDVPQKGATARAWSALHSPIYKDGGAQKNIFGMIFFSFLA